ncbi:peptidylprolyl isomerase [Parachitinimonas caeni]|uniref:peptidylprolyl isomerase n=1 Tax=Parachitinimonas caeni TaxID=3031301 RepID=A0ABT7E2V9_9NEIS|nr:peptidylprolyl isomerase [Parachitinimonas caeni]MDK2126656.1 peptidylprolyl isomerase [Parachitinimonas caeni]
MPVVVNGVELTDADMERELPNHQDQADPVKSAMTALVLQRVLLDEARQQGIDAADEQAAIETLLDRMLKVPEPQIEECQRYYDTHPEHFTVGELAEASHILFQVTERVDLEALRGRAESVLAQLLAEPTRFAEFAKECSNCPSAEVGGNLGQLGRGQTVPEFEQALFKAEAGSIVPRLIETRFGLHILQLGRKAAGQLLPFNQVQTGIANALRAASEDRALRQYLQLLVGKAQISGIDLAGADSPLVQ